MSYICEWCVCVGGGVLLPPAVVQMVNAMFHKYVYIIHCVHNV